MLGASSFSVSSHKRLEPFLSSILEKLGKGRSILLVAPPGFGKTLLGARVLAQLGSGLAITRTHSEMLEIASFLSAENVTGIPLYGRIKICPNKPPTVSSKTFYSFCQRQRELKKCNTRLSGDDITWYMARFRKPEEVLEYSRRNMKCMYPAVKIAEKKAKIALTTYDYVFTNPDALRRHRFLFLDEAQTLALDPERLIVKIDEVFIENLFTVLKQIDDARSLAYSIRSIYRKSRNMHEFMEKLERVLISAPLDLDVPELRLLEQALDNYIMNRKVYTRGKTLITINRLLPIIRAKTPKLAVSILDISPVLGGLEVIEASMGVKQKAVIIPDVTSKYSERGSEMYEKYARIIDKIARPERGVSLVVFPSYRFMDEIAKRVSIPFIRAKTLKLTSIKKLENGVIIFDVATGILTEGVNIPDLEKVVVAGFPAPYPTDEARAFEKLTGISLSTIAIIRAMQAVGRLRYRGIAYLVDSRFEEYRGMLPKWIEVT